MKKIAIITCYGEPDYVRAKVIRTALKSYDNLQIIVVKNHHRGLLRYPETMLRLIWLRIYKRPDTYLLTFRGYEILPFLALMSWPKILIYDEFINPLEWLKEPHAERWIKYIPQSLLRRFYRLLLKRCQYILADTKAHADYSSELSGISSAKFKTIVVSTDEEAFKPTPTQKTKNFRVFFYGNVRPLHGLSYIIEASEILKSNTDIEFLLVGGDEFTERTIKQAKDTGANIEYIKRIPFDELIKTASASHLCLAGPFGNTTQSGMVITGKTFQFLCAALPTVIGKTKVETPFKDEKNCLIVEQGNAKALAGKIKWTYENQNKLNAIGAEGLKTYKQYYSNAVVARQLKELILS